MRLLIPSNVIGGGRDPNQFLLHNVTKGWKGVTRGYKGGARAAQWGARGHKGVLKVERGCKGNMTEQGVCNGVIRRVKIGNLNFRCILWCFTLFGWSKVERSIIMVTTGFPYDYGYHRFPLTTTPWVGDDGGI